VTSGAPPALDPLVIVGPTASGKSALAVALAAQVPGAEIVSADAMAVYRGMDIGTAKPTVDERAGIPHHLIDVVEPTEEYTVARFQSEVATALTSIAARGAVPVVVGGTGLYVRAVVDDFTVPGRYPLVRTQLEDEPGTEDLWKRLHANDPVAAAKILPTNRRRVIRALEVTLGSGRAFSSYGPGVDRYPPSRFRQAGLELDRSELDRRIDARYDVQLGAGLVSEVAGLARCGLSQTASQALGYKEILAHLRGELTLDDALSEARRRTKRFARRQQRWFRRDPRIVWFDGQHPDLVAKVEGWWREQAAR
jgi:tRNA dimethylallyltransferase